jgi:hypothetical protein
MDEIQFGSCCKDLGDALVLPPKPLLKVMENGVLYLTVGYTETSQGFAWFDQALLFCPFCGKQLQDREEIRRKSS